MKGLRTLLVGAAGAVLGGLLLPLSGLVNFDASTGHWDVTDWFFDLAARQSVTLRSVGVEVPALDDPAMIIRGAGHYDLACAACHGSPAGPPQQFARDLTPTPPLLMQQMERWRPDARVFWTVKHGIKRTAMPAWPTQMRDDEVWDMVAFLQQIPELTPEEYQFQAGDPVLDTCARCHGEDGKGRDGAFPRLDIQSPNYLLATLKAFRDGTRASGTMMAVARTLTDEQIVTLAERYGRQELVETTKNSRGAEIARSGIPEQNIAACDACHGSAARAAYPRLGGQDKDYLINQLKLFTTLGSERGGPLAQIMADAVQGLVREDLEAVAEWYGR
ncbi:c-type cytochrome [Devosia sp. A369]